MKVKKRNLFMRSFQYAGFVIAIRYAKPDNIGSSLGNTGGIE